MAVNPLVGARFALDVKGLDSLHQAALRNPQGELKTVASKFAALFLNHMLQTMRKAGYESSLTDNRNVRMYQSMLDRQLAQSMSAGKGMGLADMLIQQLSPHHAVDMNSRRTITGAVANSVPSASGSPHAAQPLAVAMLRGVPATTHPSAPPVGQSSADDTGVMHHFVNRFLGAARNAAAASGVPSLLILAQAALETGWGQSEITTRQGGNSHNLFGMKAGASWHGPVADSGTHEYVSGQPVAMDASFRAYPSYAAAFADHAALLGHSPRYAAVRNAATPEQAARALQAGGYATDPKYADKLISIMHEIKQSLAL